MIRDRKRSYRPRRPRWPSPARLDLGLREAGPQRARQHAVPRAGREADAELLQHLAAEATALEVGPRAGRLVGVPQIAAVERRGLGEQLDQALALAAALVVAPAGVVLELDPVAVGKLLDGVAEVEPLLLLQEGEDVAARLAAEAVVELLDRVDREGWRALVVERAQPEPARAPPAQLGVGGDDLDHVGGRPHALDRLAGDAAHVSRARGTVRRSNSRMQ